MSEEITCEEMTGEKMMCKEKPVIAFYYNGKPTPADIFYGSSFLGNFYPCELTIFGRKFRNAEAAFQALKWWDSHAKEFQKLDGTSAFELKKQLDKLRKLEKNNPKYLATDWTYKNNGNNKDGMYVVLCAKFTPESKIARKLLDTGDAILVEHNPRRGRDCIWSNNNDGSGSNFLGLMLMIIRDELRSPDVRSSWRMFAEANKYDEKWSEWKTIVCTASKKILDALKVNDSSHTDKDDIAARIAKCKMMYDNGIFLQDSDKQLKSMSLSASVSAVNAQENAKETVEEIVQKTENKSAENTAAKTAQKIADKCAENNVKVDNTASKEDTEKAKVFAQFFSNKNKKKKKKKKKLI